MCSSSSSFIGSCFTMEFSHASLAHTHTCITWCKWCITCPHPHLLLILHVVFPSFPFGLIFPDSSGGAQYLLEIPKDKQQPLTMPVTSFHPHIPERPNWYSKAALKLHLRLTLVISEPHRAVCIIISDLDCVLPPCPSPEVELWGQKVGVERGFKLKLDPASETKGYRSSTHT